MSFRMKNLLYLLFFPILITSCAPDLEHIPEVQEETRTQVYSYDFIADQDHADFEAIQIDSLRNYRDLLREMQRVSCANKKIGIQFSYGDTLYGVTGYKYCPEKGENSCYFNRNFFYIKNDSLKELSRLRQKSALHISNLKTEIARIRSKEFRYQHMKNYMRPALIHFYIDPKHPISMTKATLKEVITAFKEVNTEMGADFFKYDILFEGICMMDLLPPPPPPPSILK